MKHYYRIETDENRQMPYNVQILTETGDGKTLVYAGEGKFFATKEEADGYVEYLRRIAFISADGFQPRPDITKKENARRLAAWKRLDKSSKYTNRKEGTPYAWEHGAYPVEQYMITRTCVICTEAPVEGLRTRTLDLALPARLEFYGKAYETIAGAEILEKRASELKAADIERIEAIADEYETVVIDGIHLDSRSLRDAIRIISPDAKKYPVRMYTHSQGKPVCLYSKIGTALVSTKLN